jgi:hypothetical protein
MTKNALKYTVSKNRQISESLGKQVPWRTLVILENKASLPRITGKFPLKRTSSSVPSEFWFLFGSASNDYLW